MKISDNLYTATAVYSRSDMLKSNDDVRGHCLSRVTNIITGKIAAMLSPPGAEDTVFDERGYAVIRREVYIFTPNELGELIKKVKAAAIRKMPIVMG